MTPWLDDGDVHLYHGDVIQTLRELPAGIAQTCITSPPYWGLRDYGTGEWSGGDTACDHLGEPFRTKASINANCGTGADVKNAVDRQPMGASCSKCGARRVDSQLGLEATPDLYVERLVAVFREVWRVLADSGTLWLNLGSSFASATVISDEYDLRDDISTSEREYVFGELFGLWSAVRPARDQAAVYGRHDARRGEGDVSAVLCEGVQGGVLRAAGESGAASGTLGGVPPGAQGRAQREDPGELPSGEGGSDDAAGRSLPMLRGDATPVPDGRPHRRGRQGALSADEQQPCSLDSGHSATGMPDGQVPSALLELQLRDRPVRRLPARLQLSRSDIPDHLLGYFRPHEVIKPKDDVGIPWAVARALRADGWYLRSEVIWGKSNPMPESVTDRPTKAHEQLFLLAKRPRYFYDADAIREAVQEGNTPNGREHAAGVESQRAVERERLGALAGGRGWKVAYNNPAGRNRRSVWTIPTEPFPEAHFATYPQALVRPCIQAGTSERGECSSCGAPWMREVEMTAEYRALLDSGKAWRDGTGKPDGFTNRQPKDHPANVPTKHTTTGWRASCGCDAPTRPQTVLDPFIGSGTTALVARNHGRRCIGIDLSAEYLAIAAKRLQQLSLLGELA